MQKRTTMMGTACVLAAAALTAGPAAADTLTGFAGVLTTSFESSDSSVSGTDTIKSWLLGGSVAAPLSDIAGLNFQVDGSYTHNWATHFSEEDWNFGGSAFWASMESRIGANVSYSNFNGLGHLTNGGAFGEYYWGAITAMAKGGWLSSGGASFGGHGNYLGGAVEGDIPCRISPSPAAWIGRISSAAGGSRIGRGDLRSTTAEVILEFLFFEDLGVSGYAGYRYTSDRIAPLDFHSNAWLVGVRWYLGGGSLMDHHRNGNLNPWLPGA